MSPSHGFPASVFYLTEYKFMLRGGGGDGGGGKS